MPKNEPLLALVERLDQEHHDIGLAANWEDRCEIDREWPRISRVLKELRTAVSDECYCSSVPLPQRAEGWCEHCKLLARLDEGE